jgi:hypothetical protein
MYRNEADTRRRLTLLCGPDPRLGGKYRSIIDDDFIKSEGATTRFRSLDFIYSGQWDKVRMPHMQAFPEFQKPGVPLKHWRECFAESGYLPREFPHERT